MTTPAHSAGTAVFSSLRQLATMASRSTVSTPVALARVVAWFASGESRVPCGMELGSGAMFMPHVRAFSREVETGSREENASNNNLDLRSDLIGTEETPGG